MPDEGLTPLDDCRPLVAEEDVEEVEEEVLEAVFDAVLDVDVVPGIVAALTALKMPTPATAAKAAP